MKQYLFIAVVLLWSIGETSAQTFPIGTLPPGKTIVITYDVDVNADACSPGTVPPANISNQATVSGSFTGSPKLTDDPAFPGAIDPTLTPFSGLTIGNQVYNDVNRNGIFDGGDTGINGVLLNLYQDANSNNMLDAGDGAAIASTTTANMSGQDGRYAFSICPGTYIVQVAPSNFTMGGALYNMGVPFVSSPISGAGDPDVDLDDNDSNGNPVSGFGVATAAFTIAADNNNIDFGFKTPTGISIGDVTMNEGTGGTTTSFNFTVTRTSIEDAIDLTVNTMNGTAGSPADFTAISGGPVSFMAGVGTMQTVTVLVNHDNVVEANETFTVVLSGAPPHANITDNSGLGTINNDDNATVTLSAVPSQNEGNAGPTNYTFTATLNNPVQGGFMVAYTTSNGSAMAGSDYTDNDNSLTFLGNAGETQLIQVPILGDMVVELDETFTVALGAISGAPAGVTAGPSLMGTILNDDAATVTISNVNQVEGNGPGTTAFAFTVTLNGEVDVPVNANFMTVDGTATIANNDYQSASGAIAAFTANGGASQTRIVNVQVVGDMTFESNETFLLRLSGLSASGRNVTFNPGAGATLDGTGTILNDDIPPVIINELDSDNPGTDAAEFVELYDGGVGNTSLNGLVLVFYNGANDQSYLAIDLDGFTTDANGYFIAGNAGVAGVGAIFAGNILQNGQDAVALYTANGTDFPNGTAVTTANLIDALVYDTNDPDDPGLLVLLNAGQPQVDEESGGDATCHSLQRIPNGSGGPRNTSTYQALPPTPKAANFVPEVTIAVSPASVLEDGTTDLTYTITRTGSTGCSLNVAFTVGGTATSGTDYPAIPASPITIPAGSAMATIVVNPNTDNTVEPDETVIITLVDGALYDLGTGSVATGTITNDDAATVTLTGTASQNEGTSFTFTATLNNPVQGGFSVAYTTNDGTATTADNDYTDNDGMLSFAGTANEAKTITVNTTVDNKVELNETFTVALGSITLAPVGISVVGSPQTGTITNDDVATVSIAANVSQAENLTPQVFTITLSNPVDVNVTVQFNTANNTASTSDNDYTGIVNQVVTFLAGTTTSQTVNVSVMNDNKVEANEIFDVSIGTLSASGRNVTLGTSNRTGTIINDDAATVTLAGGSMMSEGNMGTTPFVFTATLNNPVQGGFTVPYTTSDGLATTANNDYQDNDGMLTFAGTMGETKTITVLVNGDFIVEPNEGFTVELGAISGAPAGVTIAGSPQSSLILNDEIDFGDAPDSYGTLLANNGAWHFTSLIVHLGLSVDGDADGQPGVLANGDDTDAEGDDDDGVTLPSALVLNTTANISIEASIAGFVNGWVDFNLNGNFNDPGELIFNQQAVMAGANALSFAVPAGATIGSSYARFRFTQGPSPTVPTGQQTTGEVEDYAVNITNTQFSIDDPVAIAEGNVGTTDLVFTVTRSNTANACSVAFSVTGGTATTGDGDFTLITPSPINFTAGGSPTASIIVRVNGDTKVELNETVEITLANPVNGSILDGFGVGTINNDDAAVITVSSPTVTEGDAGSQVMTFDIAMSNPSDANVSVNFATMNGSATTADLDYQSTSGTHTFTPGQTMKQVMVMVNGDCKIEINESFVLQLSGLVNNGRAVSLSGGGATLNGTGTINNNDAPPMITCPMPITISCSASTLPASTGTATATDNCSPQPTVGYSDMTTPGSCIGNSTITRTWTATDNTGDMSTCMQTISLVDNTPPTPVCKTGTVVLNGNGNYTFVNNDVLNAGASSDNCSSVIVTGISPAMVTCAQYNQTINVVVNVTDDCGNPAQCTAHITVAQGTALPAGWAGTNIGSDANGQSQFEPCTNGGSFTLSAQGYTTNTTDVEHAVYQTLCGDAEIIAHVTSLAPGAGWAGVQMRETTSQGAKKFTLKTQLSTILRREIRTMTFGPTNTLQSVVPVNHTWLRVVRTGSTFTAYSSADGVSWAFRSAASIPMNSCIQVGLFVESFNNTTTTTAMFNNVSISGSMPPVGLATPETDLQPALAIPEVRIYPNPTNGQLTVAVTGAEAAGNMRCTVYNSQGQVVLTREAEESTETQTIDLSAFTDGVYWLRVQADGLAPVVHKIIKTAPIRP